MTYIRKFENKDIPEMLQIWNDVVEKGQAFPQMECLDLKGAEEFFASQSFSGVAEENGEIVGLYILHPNNVGRCGHLSNASFAVKEGMNGRGIGEALVRNCLAKGKELGFRVLQFNAVVKTNVAAIKLYTKLGFTRLGEVPQGFLMKNGEYEDIILFYKTL